MASSTTSLNNNNNIIIDDEDEDFDWEAAVREIDHACLARTSTSAATSSASTSHHPQITTTSNVNSFKQSTLDRFVSRPEPTEINKAADAEEDDQVGVPIDPEAAKTWIYPVNDKVPLRDYQLSITRTALFSNTLVVLPTGLGKTLIAAVVMYNYFRWFPTGKIIFAAPSRPLVMQQIEACHNIVGIPQAWTIDMTGQVNPTTRVRLWKDKRVFFVTPQVLENDIRSGTCLVKHLVCLVIDEAHRASGNYSYCVAVRELMDVPVQLRILALTATPGSKQQTIQQVINNLQISTLEYRNESDPDVSPYVHDRKIELIEVPMGQDAIGINNMILEVARPFVAKLGTMKVPLNRDFKTISPCDLLNARDRFRQAPPSDLPPVKYGEVEGILGALITLYHIFKLLSGHGIRPAYEMLLDKLKQGPFARLMSRNEGMQKAKLLMHQSLSNGAPSPKLSKMLEVLIDHFKVKDPLNSRVIIFSNFRGSVRDIMDALSKIGEYVKATQFIGQSSGKTLKGQSQKAQQAVLEKFRAGGYNVIVATSIGEEGLDIMEVDLVICFDANISPLRMIQRMGRTGRKNDGRVVVLACDGTELKGYKRKQANGSAIKKHLRNGMNSFNFHSSPRMIPHIFKPEIKLEELSIEQFIPRGKKVKDDHPSETPTHEMNFTDAESDLLAKYFDPAKANTTWRPSLIAFPHFQAFPSRVDKVMHSVRTGMLIDAMQSLQGLPFVRESNFSVREDKGTSSLGLEAEAAPQQDNYCSNDPWISHDSPEECILEKASDFDPIVTNNPATKEAHHIPDCRNAFGHSYLFSSDFVSVDTIGIVRVLSVPLLPSKELSHSMCLKEDSSQLKSPLSDYDKTPRSKEISEPTDASSIRSREIKNTGVLLADDPNNDLKDVEFSPRLSNFIQSGIVPESPVYCAGTPCNEGRENLVVPDLRSPGRSCTEASLKSAPVLEQKNQSESKMHLPASFLNDEIRTPEFNNIKCSIASENAVVSPVVEQVQVQLADSLSNGCSKDWCLSSGNKSASVQRERKLKRLCKLGDRLRFRSPDGDRENIGLEVRKAQAHVGENPIFVENGVGKRKRVTDARTFFEEEAEVSSEVEASDDEEDMQDINSSFEDSFIDDGANPTIATTQAVTSSCDMLAIYRRSLLSQSPMGRDSNGCTGHTPDTIASKSRTSNSEAPLETSTNRCVQSLHTPRIAPETDESEKISSGNITCRESGIRNGSKNESGQQKHKFSFDQVHPINLEKQFSCQSEAIGREREITSCDQVDHAQNIEENGCLLDDDDMFYECLDLDAVEEQAAKLLEQKLQSSQPKQVIDSHLDKQQFCFEGSPSFDLGI